MSRTTWRRTSALGASTRRSTAIAPRLQLSRSDFADASRSLAREVEASGFRPDLILAVSRGGLAPAATLSYALGVRRVDIVDVATYGSDGAHNPTPTVLGQPARPPALRGAHVLVVDDVADSGATLEVVRGLCEGLAAEVRFAVLCAKPASRIECEYVWRRTASWVDFPWSAEQPPAN